MSTAQSQLLLCPLGLSLSEDWEVSTWITDLITETKYDGFVKKKKHSCLRALESASLTHPLKMILTSTCIQILYFLQMSAIAMSGSNAPYTVVPAVALTRKGTNPYKKAQKHLAKSHNSSPNSSWELALLWWLPAQWAHKWLLEDTAAASQGFLLI